MLMLIMGVVTEISCLVGFIALGTRIDFGAADLSFLPSLDAHILRMWAWLVTLQVCEPTIQVGHGLLFCSSLAQCNTTGETRLVGGRDKYEGRIEICLNGTWGTVDRYLFSYNDSVVVCRSLGFPTVGELLCDAKFSTLHILHFLVLLQSFNGI